MAMEVNVVISRIVSAFRSTARPAPARKPCVEPMEKRLLMAAPRATSIQTDNRGEVTVTFDTPLDPTTVKSTNVQMYTPGADGIFATADDVRIHGIIRLKTGNRRIWFRPREKVPFAAGSTYSFKVSG